MQVSYRDFSSKPLDLGEQTASEVAVVYSVSNLVGLAARYTHQVPCGSRLRRWVVGGRALCKRRVAPITALNRAQKGTAAPPQLQQPLKLAASSASLSAEPRLEAKPACGSDCIVPATCELVRRTFFASPRSGPLDSSTTLHPTSNLPLCLQRLAMLAFC